MHNRTIPKIHLDRVEAHICYLGRSESEVDRLKKRIDDSISDNYGLRDFIELMGHVSTDPDSVEETAYGILALILDQKEIDELNSQAKLVYNERRILPKAADHYFSSTNNFLDDLKNKRTGGREN